MIKYLTSPEYRQTKEDLNNLEMFDNNFNHFKTEKLRLYIKSLIHLKSDS